tara:strand:+ start:674 stop:1429 length:756 start_codon:yes stop_codon:yes gene_type:complete
VSKNLIYMVSIDHHTSENKNSDYSKYSIESWKYWCDKNGVDFLLCETNDSRLARPIWNKELIYERASGYDKVGVIDSDTMIKWDAPNIFNEINEDEFCGVNDLADLNWVHNSTKAYQKFFPGLKMDYNNYINAGVLFFSKKYLYLFEEILNFYFDNQDELDNWNKGGGREQTILNFHLIKNNIKPRLLMPSWNLVSIHRKNMFIHNWQLNEDSTPFFIKYAYVWHFTGFPVKERVNIMKQLWDNIRDNYVS